VSDTGHGRGRRALIGQGLAVEGDVRGWPASVQSSANQCARQDVDSRVVWSARRPRPLPHSMAGWDAISYQDHPERLKRLQRNGSGERARRDSNPQPSDP